MKITLPRLAATIAILGALAIVAPGFSLMAADPAGNNGTIKVDGVAFDNLPDNEPHVGCRFEIDFYGFDKGQYFADVTFDAQPPSGTRQLLTDRVFIGEDENDGGGSLGGHDASQEYSLKGHLDGLDFNRNQGYHVKLTINADGSRGADVKHKVFWVTGCQEPDPSPS